MESIILYIKEFIYLLNEMSPYLLLGFFFAGILHVYFPEHKIYNYLGRRNFLSVTHAALIGIPLPLCSCGVIPTGLSFYKNGASKGSSVSFLISTPQTGIDSILVTYSLLGLPLAIIRPIIAFTTGIFGGLFTNIADKKEKHGMHEFHINHVKSKPKSIVEMLRYAFIEFLGDIAKWLAIGLLLAALIAILMPDNFFSTHIGNDYIDMLIVLVAAIPLYVCATGSVPIAAILIMKGISPGAAIVFLMAGPATNIATITLIGKELGGKTLFIYLLSIITGALFFGFIINTFLPREWFTSKSLIMAHGEHGIHLLPEWIKYISSIIISFFIVFTLLKNNIPFFSKNRKKITPVNTTIDSMKIKVEGMTCNHCRATVENALESLPGVKSAEANIKTKEVILNGTNINDGDIKKIVEEKGYQYVGIID